ncbi:hypothetical protein M6B38_340025 [Iris pallida]|uniref:Uncharacterized protein n=1 Tax=Iris pallida TaxID=29817 RepID=A0AAX6GYS7_IRIPA|nr:hypothetical protein M6B38_340025 [Iris pallida]
MPSATRSGIDHRRATASPKPESSHRGVRHRWIEVVRR